MLVGSATGLRAFDPTSGASLWTSSRSIDCSSSPILAAAGTELVYAEDLPGNLYAFPLATGKLLWSYPADPVSGLWPSLCADARRLYVSRNRTAIALDLLTGELLATSPDLGGTTRAGNAVRVNQLFQLVDLDGDDESGARLIALDPHNVANVLGDVGRRIGRSARPIIDSAHLHLNAATARPAIHDTLQAFRLR